MALDRLAANQGLELDSAGFSAENWSSISISVPETGYRSVVSSSAWASNQQAVKARHA